MTLIPIILCGGHGSRLWPLSTETEPKPFLRLPTTGKSLFQAAVQRASNLSNNKEIIVCINQEHFFIAQAQIQELTLSSTITYLIEPIVKDTAAAITSATLYLASNYRADQVNVVILAADHIFNDEDILISAIREATQLMPSSVIVLGIKPKSPHTGYGYIHVEKNKVISFHEKPHIATATQYLQTKNYLWNSGMLLFNIEHMLNKIKKTVPIIFHHIEHSLSEAVIYQNKTGQQIILCANEFQKIQSISFDKAVLEKIEHLAVIDITNSGWRDIGTWDSFTEQFPNEQDSNYTYGNTVLDECYNCLIHSDSSLIAVSKLSNIVVVAHDNMILIADRANLQQVKQLYEKVKEKALPGSYLGSTIFRPWGHYTVLQQGMYYKVKQVVIQPGGILSLQHHIYRSEHWIVVQGEALVTHGQKQYIVKENESTYIEMGEIHRVENRQETSLIMIEVQTGKYLEEDDIIRHEDVYHRI